MDQQTNGKMNRLREESEKARRIFDNYPCGNEYSDQIEHEQVEALAVESARVLGEGYLHTVVFYNVRDHSTFVETKAFYERPRFNAGNGHADGFANQQILLARAHRGNAKSAEIQFSPAINEILLQNPDIKAENIFERRGEFEGRLYLFDYNAAKAMYSATYKLNPKEPKMEASK